MCLTKRTNKKIAKLTKLKNNKVHPSPTLSPSFQVNQSLAKTSEKSKGNLNKVYPTPIFTFTEIEKTSEK